MKVIKCISPAEREDRGQISPGPYSRGPRKIRLFAPGPTKALGGPDFWISEPQLLYTRLKTQDSERSGFYSITDFSVADKLAERSLISIIFSIIYTIPDRIAIGAL